MNVPLKLAPALICLTPLGATPAQTPAHPAAAIDGAWAGAINVGVPLRVIFTFKTTAEGLTATLTSPDQSPAAIPAETAQFDGHALTVEIGKIQGKFAGTVDLAAGKATGTWTQMGRDFPLTLTRSSETAALAPKRPQEPQPPFPYRSEDVTFASRAPGVRLAGTLTLPQGAGPFPAAILIAGSGPNDRDEYLMGHKPFLVLADFLTRHGIAVLRADKRGVGQSTGDYAAAVSADFAADVEGGVAYLRNRPDIDRRRIGLIGHSEGGLIAPMVAADEPAEIAFVVMLAGPGVSGADVLVEQVRLLMLSSGKSADEAAQAAERQRQIVHTVVSTPDESALRQKLTALLEGYGFPDGAVKAQVDKAESPWFRSFLAYDPAATLARVRCPVLALNGDKDVQVSAAQNLPAIKAAVLAGGNTHVETDLYLGLNHLFQMATTGSPSEYSSIEETMAPVVLEKVANWIAAQPPLPVPPHGEKR